MVILYADTSAVVGAYLQDEPEHEDLAAVLFDRANTVFTSELTRIEFASAVSAAIRARRLRRSAGVDARFEKDSSSGGVLGILRLDPLVTFPLARALVIDHPLRTLEAIHLAVALTAARQIDPEVTLLTRDHRQSDAAAAMGLPVR